ncbi:MAG TPA: hypothetical protein VFU76_11935 [Terriglobales bacterium]|nr:hypothetical protein [Terriglobales bacterium]
MSLRTIALSTALLLGAALAAGAQTGPFGGWGQPGTSVGTTQQNGQNVAYQRGMQDGMRDGQRDQQSGHSFRPTQTDKYKDAPGYSGLSGIPHDQYVQIYRQSYMQGYQQGFSATAGNNPNGPNEACDSDGDDCRPAGTVYGQTDNYPVYGGQYPQQNYPVYGQPGYPAQNGLQVAFQRGAQQGQIDGQSAAQQGRRSRISDNYKTTPGYDASLGISFGQYQDAYRQGYKQAYDQAVGYGQQQNYPVYGQQYPQQNYPVYGQPGYPGNGGYGIQNAGYQRGFQDGLTEGARDRQSGHSARPQHSDKYDDTPGYNSSYGDKGQWKQMYRQGFVAGYQQGYNGSPR